MSDFSLTTLFVDKNGGTLASSGSTQDLAAGVIGLFGPDYTIVNAGNIASVDYFYIAQGRIENTPGLGSKRSDKIAASKVIEWYKTVGEPDAVPNESWVVSDFNVKCDEDFTITIVAHSSYIDTVAFNGLTRSVTVKSACCDCGELPCTSLSGDDVQNLVDALAAKINLTSSSTDGSSKLMLSKYFTAVREGSGSSSVLRITSKALDSYGNACDPAAFPWEYDRIWFRVFAYTGPATTQDFIVADSCNVAAVAAVQQRSLYPKGSSAELKQLEKNLYSYQTSHSKHLHRLAGYNQGFESYVVDGTTYDIYYLKCRIYDQVMDWTPHVAQDFTVMIAFATGTGSTFETALTAALGAPVNKSGADVTTTTTTSTSSTTTTTTTAPLIP